MPSLDHTSQTWPTPRFGGLFRGLSRRGRTLTLRLAGKRWNPIFSVVEHVGRRTGRLFATPVAARRVAGGFVVSLAFGADADWHRNLITAAGGTVRWRGQAYQVRAPERIDPQTGLAAFAPAQRFFLRVTRIDGYVYLSDAVV